MMEVDEIESMDDSITMEKSLLRERQLGFKPQKEIYYNKHLPISQELVDQESNKMLQMIKQQLGLAVASSEINPGVGVYSSKLLTYIKLYGLKFSKEDHIRFIKIFLEILFIPYLEPSKVNKICVVLSQLLRRSELLSPDDLQLGCWKSLYKIFQIYCVKSSSKSDLYRYYSSHNQKQEQENPLIKMIKNAIEGYGYNLEQMGFETKLPPTMEQNLSFVIQLCAYYFPPSSTQEIIDELLPRLQPLETGKPCEIFEVFSMFINPTYSHEIWFEHFFKLWETYHTPAFTGEMMNLMAVVGLRMVGLIDWEPYIPVMFTRILRSLNLPVCYKSMKSAKSQNVCQTAAATWIVSVLGPQSSAIKYLRNFMKCIETYLHPANAGKYSSSISELLIQVTAGFVDRLYIERYKKPNWKRQHPESHKLTEKDITDFVECLKPVALQAMYSSISPNDAAKLFKNLADLRPELILPEVILRVQTTIDSVTEPMKYTNALQILSNLTGVMVSGNNGYTVSRNQVIPIMLAVLPGIDVNDFKKTAITLQFLISQSLLIPIVDCSKASQFYDDLTDEEHELCEQTARFEDFVLEFLDRIFAMIEASASQTIRMDHSSQMDLVSSKSKLEQLSEGMIQTSSNSILGQCSQPILDEATSKLVRYVKTTIFEPKVSGPAMAVLLRVFGRVNGKNVLKALVPHFAQLIERHFEETEDVYELDKQSDEFLYYLRVLLELMRCDPYEVQDYVHYTIPIMDKLIKCKCFTTNRTSNLILTNLLGNISTMQTMDIKTVPDAYSKPLKDFLPIRHWGQKSSIKENFKWFIPGEKERNMCEMLIWRYVIPSIDNLNLYIKGELEMSREEMARNLHTLTNLFKCSNLLPNWQEDSLPLYESVTKKIQNDVNLGLGNLEITSPDGKNFRIVIVDLLNRLQPKLIEDDIKSFKQLLAVYDKVHIRRHANPSHEIQLKGFHVSRAFQEHKLTKKKRDIRAVVAARVLVQQDLRDECVVPLFTPTHRLIMLNLLKLSTSKYAVVRSVAQSKLFSMINTYNFSNRSILMDIAEYLKLDPNLHHDAFKGALYVIGGNRRSRLVVSNNWDYMEVLWLTLLKTELSEKPSIVKIIDNIGDSVYNEFQTLNTEIEVSDKIIQLGVDLAPGINQEIIDIGKINLKKQNENNVAQYYRIIKGILDYANNNALHWRYQMIASSMLHNLVHPLTFYPVSVLEFTINRLVHDSIEERKLSLDLVKNILKQIKRDHVRISVDPFKHSGEERPKEVKIIRPGSRKDNQWLQYDEKRWPKSQEEWDEPRFIFKTNGFFGWSKDLQLYAPSAQQPKLDRTINEMSDHEKVIYNFFFNKENVEKLVEYWCLEEKKGKDKFNRTRFTVIKMLVDYFGDLLLPNFVEHLYKLIENKTNENCHRCASEIMAGIMRGMKHWPFEKSKKLYEEHLQPLIRLSLSNITNETFAFWGTCYATSAEGMEPNKQYWLYEALMEDPIRENSSYNDCSRLYCLQGAFNQQVWRMESFAYRLMDLLRPFLSHPFQIVRERIGSILINIFEGDLCFEGKSWSNSPKVSDMLAELAQPLEILFKDDLINNESLIIDPNSEFAASVRLFKTVAQWITGVINRGSNGNEIEYFKLLPACRIERCEQDKELADSCSSLLAMISQALTLPSCMAACLDKIDQVSQMSSWSARVAIIDIMQVVVFNNLLIVLSAPEWVEKVQSIVLRLLEDNILEVREKAAQVLGGLLHCAFLPATDKLLELFKKKCKTKVIKRANLVQGCAVEAQLTEDGDVKSVTVRHMGVLGLCAFISAYPYEVPEFIPAVFEHLGNHLNDPQPIPTTIRKTLADFKRTHFENWHVHQMKFTEHQLSVLSDLSVPPTYYA